MRGPLVDSKHRRDHRWEIVGDFYVETAVPLLASLHEAVTKERRKKETNKKKLEPAIFVFVIIIVYTTRFAVLELLNGFMLIFSAAWFFSKHLYKLEMQKIKVEFKVVWRVKSQTFEVEVVLWVKL